jgi:hypothetical protein
MPQKKIFRFRAFEADPGSGELRKSATRLRLQEQTFEILPLVVEHPGEERGLDAESRLAALPIRKTENWRNPVADVVDINTVGGSCLRARASALSGLSPSRFNVRTGFLPVGVGIRPRRAYQIPAEEGRQNPRMVRSISLS